MADEERQQGGQPEIIMSQEMMPGVWANFAAVSHTAHEFTIDFTRMEADGRRGIVVSRVSVSPLFISQLIDALNTNWSNYAEKAMPQEVNRREDDEQASGA